MAAAVEVLDSIFKSAECYWYHWHPDPGLVDLATRTDLRETPFFRLLMDHPEVRANFQDIGEILSTGDDLGFRSVDAGTLDDRIATLIRFDGGYQRYGGIYASSMKMKVAALARGFAAGVRSTGPQIAVYESEARWRGRLAGAQASCSLVVVNPRGTITILLAHFVD